VALPFAQMIMELISWRDRRRASDDCITVENERPRVNDDLFERFIAAAPGVAAAYQ